MLPWTTLVSVHHTPFLITIRSIQFSSSYHTSSTLHYTFSFFLRRPSIFFSQPISLAPTNPFYECTIVLQSTTLDMDPKMFTPVSCCEITSSQETKRNEDNWFNFTEFAVKSLNSITNLSHLISLYRKMM